MKKILLFIGTLFIFFLTSCKKEKIEEEGAELIGTWQWVYSEKEEFVCEPPSYSSIITPESENLSAEFTIEEKGILVYTFDTVSSEYRVIDQQYNTYVDPDFPNNLSYVIVIENVDDKTSLALKGVVFNDTIEIIDYFPFADQYFHEGSSICATYTNYFVRE